MAGWTVADRGRIYGEAYEARQRDPVVDIVNRASVANGRMNRWQRFHRGTSLVWVDDAEGHPRALTPTQARVCGLALSMTQDSAGAPYTTMRAMAAALAVSPSTVSRALTKLAAWGIIAYVCGRGRYAGLVIFRRMKNDGWEAFRRLAKDRIRRWSEAANRRLSRLALNVAPYINEEGVRVLSDPLSTTSSKGATLTAQRTWTPDELRSVGVI